MRLEKQRKLAQTLRLKAEAEETGEDLERKKAWEWSIEQNERWESKMQESKEKGETLFHSESCLVSSRRTTAEGQTRRKTHISDIRRIFGRPNLI